jgi:hypothetical protein
MEKSNYKCNVCNKFYKNYKSLWKHNYIYHKPDSSSNSSKTSNSSSILSDNFECNYCNKKLSRIDNLKRHEKTCKLKKEKINKTINNITNNTKIKNQTNNTNNGTINNDNKKIIINNFGNNNIECLTDKFMKKLVKEFYFEEDFTNPIPMLIEKINFNSDYKENNNSKILSLRSKIGYKYIDGKWLAIEKEKLLNELFKSAHELLENFINDLEDIGNKLTKEGFDNYLNKVDTLKQIMKDKIEMISYLYFKNGND